MRMDTLIQKRGTGNAEEFARKVKISRSSIFRYINDMRTNFDAPIGYCEIRQSYFYENEFSLKDFF